MPDDTGHLGNGRHAGSGHIELERRVDAIVVGVRHRKDLGDIDALARSIAEVGLLQPITITPDGVLVCGWRRLQAVRRLGWTTLKVWVRSGISDELSHLLAQQDENELRKPLTQLETWKLYHEVKRLMAEEAERRQEATRFGAGDAAGVSGAVGPAAPRGSGDSRSQASQLVTGSRSYTRLEQIGWIQRTAEDASQPASIREFARNMLAEIEDDAPVEPAYKRVRAAVELARTAERSDPGEDGELARLAAEALERVRQGDARKGVRALQRQPTGVPRHRSLRSFILTWTELEGWSALYDVGELAGALSEEEWERFERVVEETSAFADRLRTARVAAATA
ncbi:MAG: ParB N-terminal domain-containing protein [Nocardioidaceae bacterium]|nr:ParB N-terminal domain-containing protein [Nocardioidaceae bacterium]